VVGALLLASATDRPTPLPSHTSPRCHPFRRTPQQIARDSGGSQTRTPTARASSRNRSQISGPRCSESSSPRRVTNSAERPRQWRNRMRRILRVRRQPVPNHEYITGGPTSHCLRPWPLRWRFSTGTTAIARRSSSTAAEPHFAVAGAVRAAIIGEIPPVCSYVTRILFLRNSIRGPYSGASSARWSPMAPLRRVTAPCDRDALGRRTALGRPIISGGGDWRGSEKSRDRPLGLGRHRFNPGVPVRGRVRAIGSESVGLEQFGLHKISSVDLGSEEHDCVPIHALARLIWAVNFRSDGRDLCVPLRPVQFA
jgi:hypothetical protein